MGSNRIGFWGWLAVVAVLGLAVEGVERCSSSVHKKQEIILPEYAFFDKTTDNPAITFQTFGREKGNLVCLNYVYPSGRMAELYCVLKNGNEIYDKEDVFCGYLVVHEDGSFDIKGSKIANGHYVGEAKMRVKGSSGDSSDKKASADASRSSSPLEVLKVIYPNRQGDGEPEDFTEYKTERFYWYERIESDFDVLWQTQDGYTYVEKPNPAFTPYPGIDNAYIVEWTQSEGAGRTRVGLVFVNQDGKWLVDNAWPVGEDASAEPKMYFDYSKVPEHWASDDAMDDEERAFVRKVKKMLGQ